LGALSLSDSLRLLQEFTLSGPEAFNLQFSGNGQMFRFFTNDSGFHGIVRMRHIQFGDILTIQRNNEIERVKKKNSVGIQAAFLA
jgi:hypothetical protein